jgi:hypothetical protein
MSRVGHGHSWGLFQRHGWMGQSWQEGKDHVCDMSETLGRIRTRQRGPYTAFQHVTAVVQTNILGVITDGHVFGAQLGKFTGFENNRP